MTRPVPWKFSDGQLIKIAPMRSNADELQFTDADIRAAFETGYFVPGTPTMVQLARELRLLREQLAKGEK